MPVYQDLINFNQLFAQLTTPPIIVNDLVNIDEEEKKKIRNLVISEFSSDMVSIVPACSCRELKGEYAVGIICKKCNTPVKPVLEDSVEPILWFRAPIGVAKLINPIIWIMLNDRFKKPGFSIVQWLADTTYRPPVKQPPVLDALIASNIPRGYNSFVENFDSLMEMLFSMKDFADKSSKSKYLERLLREERDKVFSDYLPIPNKALLVIEKTNVGVYIDPIVVKAIDAVEIITSIDSGIMDHTPKIKENRTIKAIVNLASFYDQYASESLAGKTGQFRKQIMGSRTNYNFRAVISSITDQHKYDEIYAPWGVGITAFRPHLINKLLKKGYSLNASIGMLLGHVEKYSPLLDSLLKELIEESPMKGIPVMEQRNPTMLSGSAQMKRIAKFKTDPSDHTVSTSILTVKSMNADLDGDEVNYSIALDDFLASRWKALAPHNNVFLATTPREVSGNISIPKPVISTISNWMSTPEQTDPQKYEEMKIFT